MIARDFTDSSGWHFWLGPHSFLKKVILSLVDSGEASIDIGLWCFALWEKSDALHQLSRHFSLGKKRRLGLRIKIDRFFVNSQWLHGLWPCRLHPCCILWINDLSLALNKVGPFIRHTQKVFASNFLFVSDFPAFLIWFLVLHELYDQLKFFICQTDLLVVASQCLLTARLLVGHHREFLALFNRATQRTGLHIAIDRVHNVRITFFCLLFVLVCGR